MKRMKLLKRGLLVFVLLLVVGGVVVYFYLDRLVQRTVETQATDSLHLQTTLGGASLSVFGGKLGLSDLQIASPQGFAAPHMLTLGNANVAVSYGQLGKNPVHVASITLDRPMLVIEQANGEFNFRKAQDGMSPSPAKAPDGTPTAPPQPSAPQPSAPQPAPQPAGEQMKMIVDELTVKDATVVLRPGLDIPGVPKEITIPISTFTMRNVGTGDGNQNGAAMKDVVMQVVTALAAQANTSKLIPPEIQALLNGDLSSVMNRLGAEAQQRVLAAIPGEAGQVLSKLVADPTALTKDPGKALGGVVEGLKGKLPPVPGLPTTGPSGAAVNPLDDPAKAAGDALGGVLGGKKEKKDKGKK